ncbi:amino acid/polyamine transporter I [Sporodiniella umbellata]|nr:amino acid/polyamine transporter I [Sporodiniella umbellata]
MCIALVITAIHVFLNIHDIQHINLLNQWNVFWSCTGLLIVIAVLSCFAPHRSMAWVFSHYENETGFESPVYVFLLGTMGCAFSLFGCECAASVNEETKDADISSSIAIVSSIVMAWAVGLAFLVVLLFSIQDIESILNTQFDMPVTQLFQDAIGTGGALGFLFLILICQFCTGASTVAVASRQLYALARDQATPASDLLKTISPSGLPTYAILATFLFTCVFIFPFPFSEHVFDTIVSAATITIHFSYAMVLGCRLMNPHPTKGRFHLGRWSYTITLIGFAWSVFAVIAFLLPTCYPFTWENANYAGLGLMLVTLPTFLFWILWGKYRYMGPLETTD